MSTRHLLPLFAAVLLAAICAPVLAAPQAAAQKPTTAAPAGPPMSRDTRMMVIRSLNAEYVWVRRPLPMGEKGITLKNGQIVSPDSEHLELDLARYGPAAKPGDRAQITDVVIKDNRILFDINGGPKKKTKWYQHISVSASGGTAQVPDDALKNAHGARIELAFDKYVPEITGDQVRQLLSPLFDFKAKSATEAYIDTVPPKVKDAIKNHAVLVGMNREMVTYAKGRPERKIREKSTDGKEYEEWLYGAPPQEVQFVRFEGDQVVRLEIMKVDGEKLVRTEREVDLPKPEVAEKQEQPKARPVKAPTLRRPGEPPDELPHPNGGAGDPSPASQPVPLPPPSQTPVPGNPPGTPPGGVPPPA